MKRPSRARPAKRSACRNGTKLEPAPAAVGWRDRARTRVMHMLRIGLLALALASVASTAAAQQPRVVAGAYPAVMLDAPADALSQRPLREGDEVLRVDFPYDRVGRLQNDVYQSRWGDEDLVMPAGTPLYRTRYRYLMLSSEPGSDAVIHDLSWPMWCGPTTTDARRAVGHCIILRSGRAESARVEGASLHSNELSAFAPVTMPQIAEDASAARTLPRAQLVYRIAELRRGHVIVQVDLEEGDNVETWQRLRARRNGDGEASLVIDGRTLRIQAAGDAVRFSLEDAADPQRLAEARR